jgi:prophage regulatory protein
MDAIRFVRERECHRMTGLSRTTRWTLERKGAFPGRHQISTRTVGWLESDVQDWIRSHAARALASALAERSAKGTQAADADPA